MTTNAIAPYEHVRKYMRSDVVKERFVEITSERDSMIYISCALLAVANNEKLQLCKPESIFRAAFQAALLRLTVDPNLGRAYIVPFGNHATFIIGYKGLIEMATRTGKYRIIHCARIHEGMNVEEDILTGQHRVTGYKTSNKIVGYLAYFEMTSGYSKTLYMSLEDIHAHAKRYSKSYDNPNGLWKTNPEVMERKTPLRLLLMQWGSFSNGERNVLKDEDNEEMPPLPYEDEEEIEAPDFGAVMAEPEPPKVKRTEQEIIKELYA